jgi:hypothetical protein
MKKYLLLFLVSISILSTQAQQIKNEDLVYDENIHTVLLFRAGNQLDPPVIQLGSNDKLQLMFDDMSNETYRFKYTFVHCTANWKDSQLEQFEYLDGYYEDEIMDYQFSVNAIPGYIHYDLMFPNANMNIKLSGNYILKVYLDEPTDENIIFTRRFFVTEPLVNISVTIPYYPKKLEFTRFKQQIDLKLTTPDLFNAEPMQRMNVTIQQNGRWDNAKTGLKPTSISMNMLDYDYPAGIVFDGGNDFRHFNMESFWYKSMYISEIISNKEGYDVMLHTEGTRKGREYETLNDLNGKCVVQARKDQVTATEGEYAHVFFSLKIPEFKDADVYILGQLNDWQLNDKSLMKYDSRYRMYTGEMFLKQGFYEYNYVLVQNGSTKGDITAIEGDHWETDNNYTVYVYYREKVPEYDRLVGYMIVNSREVGK